MTAVDSPTDRRLRGDLAVAGVTVTYGELCAVRPLDLALTPGAMVAVTGPSGAGKSSLMWALAGAVRPSAGTVHLGGEPVTDREGAAAMGVVIVPQGNALASALTAEENVLVPLLAAGVPVAEAAHRTRSALAEVGLEESGRHLIEELSGGQQQRVALARALAARATALLADEPTSDLDSVNRERVIAALRAEAAAGAMVLMSTHDPEAAAQADAELALDEGVARWVRPL
jgi:putative ABC transport system ATP-binding protein